MPNTPAKQKLYKEHEKALNELHEASRLLDKTKVLYTKEVENLNTPDKKLMEIELAVIQGSNLVLEKLFSYQKAKRKWLSSHNS